MRWLRCCLPGWSGELSCIGPGPGLQGLGERQRLLADAHAGQLGDVGDGAVCRLQAVLLSGCDVDRGEHDPGRGRAELPARFPAVHRREGQCLGDVGVSVT